MCGAPRNKLSSAPWTASISDFIEIIASQNLSNSIFDSDSVGSIINVLGTGHDIVGA